MSARVLQLYTYDKTGAMLERSRIGFGDEDLWPYAFAEQIAELLEHGVLGSTYSLNRWWYGKVLAA